MGCVKEGPDVPQSALEGPQLDAPADTDQLMNLDFSVEHRHRRAVRKRKKKKKVLIRREKAARRKQFPHLSSRAATPLNSAVPRGTSVMLHLSARYFPREKLRVLGAATSFRLRMSRSNLSRGRDRKSRLVESRAAVHV